MYTECILNTLMRHALESPLNPVDGFLPLKPVDFLVLLALFEGPRHGYAIKKAVERRSEGTVSMQPGTLYRLIARLVETALLEDCGERPAEGDDERRRYYQLTALGRAVVAAEARRLANLVAAKDVRGLAEVDG